MKRLNKPKDFMNTPVKLLIFVFLFVIAEVLLSKYLHTQIVFYFFIFLAGIFSIICSLEFINHPKLSLFASIFNNDNEKVGGKVLCLGIMLTILGIRFLVNKAITALL